ncbi:phage head morphogenesis protein, partial [Klebsiella pneumoniae]
MQASVVYWLSENYRASGAAVAMDASPAVMMRNAMQKLAKRWKRRFDDMAQKLADRFANDAMKNADASLATAFKDAGFTVEFKM